MYDTVNLFINDEAGLNLASLSNISEHYKGERMFYSGSLKNYKVTVNENGIFLKGSLAKYFLDDNIKTLNRGDTQRAIECLGDDLKINLASAKVTRVDLSHNMLMQYTPEAYYDYLGSSQYYKRLLQPNSIYYNNKQRTKLFYNKISESKSKGIKLPEVVNNQNLLRYELRFKSRISKQLGELKAKDLFDEKFYITLVDRWLQEYQSIEKNKVINLNLTAMQTPKDFWKQSNLHWIKLIGIDTALKMVDDMKARQAFEKKEYYSRLKKEIKDLASQPDLTDNSELIDELDKKVGRIKVYYR